MSHEATLRDMYDAMNRKDASAAASALTDDAVFHMLPNPVISAATLTGRQEILAFMEQGLAKTDMQQQISAISENGDFATVYVESRSTGDDGVEHVVKWADLFQFAPGTNQICGHVSFAG